MFLLGLWLGGAMALALGTVANAALSGEDVEDIRVALVIGLVWPLFFALVLLALRGDGGREPRQ